ncbi:MAG: TraB/GumN family protein [Pseudomonadota bacterium]
MARSQATSDTGGHMRIERALVVICLLVGTSVLCAGESRTPPTEQPSGADLEEFEEVLITGTQPGPPLWKVKSGNHVLWIMGEVTPLPKRLKWRSKQVERVLADAKEILLESGVPGVTRPQIEGATAPVTTNVTSRNERYLPNGQTLRDLLSPEGYVRFETVRARYAKGEKDAERFTPGRAAIVLFNNALRRLEFAQEFYPISKQVVAMANRRHIKVTGVMTAQYEESDPSRPDSLLSICGLEAILVQLNDGGAGWKAQANAWAIGNIDRLKQFAFLSGVIRGRVPPTCAIEDKVDDQRFLAASVRRAATWLSAAERVLADNSSTMAVVEMMDLLAPDGLIASLRARGYEVVEP